MSPDVVVIGGASWNTIVTLDRLPESRPHTITALGHGQALGGTSAGKALHLAALGRHTTLVTVVSDDDDGRRIVSSLRADNLRTIAVHGGTASEHHLNLMTPAGERLSIYLDHAPAFTMTPRLKREISREIHAAAMAAVDLSDVGLEWLDEACHSAAQVVVDLHNYDGQNSFHEPFIAASDFVFMNDDAMTDPVPFLRRVVERGALLGVCTLGARGAIGVCADGTVVAVPAVPTTVVDTNGAGDAFAAGVIDFALASHVYSPLDAVSARRALEAGALQAAVAVRSWGVGPGTMPLQALDINDSVATNDS